jgi:glutamate racemase
MQELRSQPIGIFDSGVGGLTIAKAIVNALPNENLIYYGDTAHLPYGDKSQHTIQAYTLSICDFLVKQQCKTIVIACNSASAAASQLVHEKYPDVSIINVIDPMIDYFKLHGDNYKKTGLIATKHTVSSNIYQNKFKLANIPTQLLAMATPLLVPLIEFGYSNSHILDEVISDYLDSCVIADINALILGCTHYPIIKTKFHQFFEKKAITNIDIIDATTLVPAYVRSSLVARDLLNNDASPYRKFLVSDYTDSFAEVATLFFGDDIKLELQTL